MLIEKENLYRNYIATMMRFADTTTSIEAAMVAIRWISPNGDFERVPEFIKGQCQKWQRNAPENPMTGQLCHVANKHPARYGWGCDARFFVASYKRRYHNAKQITWSTTYHC